MVAVTVMEIVIVEMTVEVAAFKTDIKMVAIRRKKGLFFKGYCNRYATNKTESIRMFKKSSLIYN